MYSSEPPSDEIDDWADEPDVSGGSHSLVDLSDYDLVVGMAKGGAASFDRYIERFHRILLDYGRRAGVPAAERDELVDETLSDVAMRFMTMGAVLPRNPRMYLLAAFRRKVINNKRGRDRRQRIVSEATRDALVDCDYADDAEVAAGCSQGILRDSRGPDLDGASLPRVLDRLSACLSEALTEDERQLLIGVADNVPQREIASWLAVTHVVARKRLQRLRARLVEVAMHHEHSLEPDDARELKRFFRRCGARMGTTLVAHASVDAPRRELQSYRTSSED